MRVKMHDLTLLEKDINEEFLSTIAAERTCNVIKNGVYLKGPQNAAFEQEFLQTILDFNGTGISAMGVGNGFDGLQIALRSLGIGRGDDVLVPWNAPLPVWMAVTITGARLIPLYANVWGVIDEDSIQKITQRVQAIIVVHMYGYPADVDTIRSVLPKEVTIIEDCSHAHGAEINGKKVGTFGDIAVFSCYPTKPLGALGDAGVIVAPTKQIETMRMIAEYGGGYFRGINSRLDELQAVYLRLKLPYVEKWNAMRAHNAEFYWGRLKDLYNSISMILPAKHPGHVWHQFVILHEKRDELRRFLSERGIETGIHYDPFPPNTPVYRHSVSANVKKDAAFLSSKVLSLPVGQHLDDEDLEYVCQAILDFEAKGH